MISTKRIYLILVNIFVFFAFLSPPTLYSQIWKRWVDKEHPTFREIREAFDKFSQKKQGKRIPGWKQYKRWEWFAENRLDPNGYFDPTLNWKGWLEKQERFCNDISNFTAAGASWSLLGPVTIPETYNQWGFGGMGRINTIAFHPSNPDIIWVGSPSGGLWKTMNGGVSWNNLTDNLPNLGVSSILVHPQNPAILYIATGDGDGGDTFTIGILKSTDGGDTWNLLGLGQDVSIKSSIHKLAMHPTNPDILMAATSQGIYKSTDAGETWIFKTNPPNFKDIEVDRSNPSIWYGTSFYYGIYKSTDTGETWTRLSSGLPQQNSGFGRIAIAISRGTPSTIYALYVNNDTQGFYGLYRSIDSGNTWQLQSASPNLMGWDVYGLDWSSGGQGYYDLILDVDPANPDIVYAGGVNLWKSYNGGKSWEIIGHWYGALNVPYVHADHHDFIFHPNDNNTIFSGNDGGIFKSTDGGATWTDLSSGLAVHQVYRLGQSAADSSKIVIGNQDNGSDFFNGNTWLSVYGGDGMECAIDPEFDNIMYCSIYYGSFYRSTTSGATWDAISGPFAKQGAWVTPFIMDSQSSSTLYVATNRIYKSTDRGSNWTDLSGELVKDKFIALVIAPSDTNYIYAATRSGSLFRTTDGGTTWTQTGNADSGTAVTTTWLEVDLNTPTILWQTCGGYVTGQKVFRSTDGGQNWENLSGMLPNVPANCITIDPFSRGIYVGTDLGVFYSPGADGNWVTFDTGLPNVIVNELEIHLNSRMIRAATYGRGVWESPLADMPDIFPPVNLTGERKRNKSLMLKEYMDVLTWETNPRNKPGKVTGYRIYKMVDKELIQVTEVNADMNEYWVRKVENVENIYYVSSVDSQNSESARAYVRIKL
jgi:photosystem II stability/assembly factor-like uncharacterized protein